MLHLKPNTPAISTRHWAGYLWNTTWCPAKTLVTDGYRDLFVHGGQDGDALYVFDGGVLLDLDPGVRTHEAAVAWAAQRIRDMDWQVAA